MSIKSQEGNLQKLVQVLSRGLCNIYGEREQGPNGDKRVFLHVGAVFLRALARDLGLKEARVTTNAEGIGSPGSCTLMGMWEAEGLYLTLTQFSGPDGRAILYRSIRDMQDYKGGYNRFLTVRELAHTDYPLLLEMLGALKMEDANERIA